jgi:hypothetical protein
MLYFLKNPNYVFSNNGSLNERIKLFLRLFFYCYCAIILLGLFVFLFDKILMKEWMGKDSIFELYKFNSKMAHNKFGTLMPLYIILIFPIIEEFVFRYALNFKRESIAVCVSLIIYRFLGSSFTQFDTSSFLDYFRLVFSVSVYFLLSRTLSEDFLANIRKVYFPYIFYFSAVSFALVHISNFNPIQYDILYFYPLYVLPQFAMGLFFGYIRLKQGFFWSVLLHSAINLPSGLLILYS